MILRSGLIALVLSTPALGADPGIEEGLKQRRDHLQKLEEHVQALRDEVKLQLGDAVAGQHLSTVRAEKEYRDARLAREVAEFQVKEYVQGIYLQDLSAAEGAVKLAADDLERAREELKLIRQMVDKGLLYARPGKVMAAQLQLQQAEFDYERAKLEVTVLTNYTKEKETRKREAAVASAEALEAEKKYALDSERARERKLEEQAERFKVRSPEDQVLALLDDAIGSESKVGDLIAEARKIEAQSREKPDDAAKLADQLRAKKAEADALMGRAKSQLFEAVTLGEQVRKLRASLRDAEAGLKKERELVDRLEREFGSRK